MTDDPTGTPNDENLKILREKAGQVDSLTTQVQDLTRQLAIRDSKINTDHPAFELFQKGYDGEWSPEDLNTAAEKYGLLKEDPASGAPGSQQTPPSGQQQQPGMGDAGSWFAQQAAAQARMAEAQQGGAPNVPGQLSDDSWKQAQSPDEFMARYQQAGGVVTSD